MLQKKRISIFIIRPCERVGQGELIGKILTSIL